MTISSVSICVNTDCSALVLDQHTFNDYRIQRRTRPVNFTPDFWVSVRVDLTHLVLLCQVPRCDYFHLKRPSNVALYTKALIVLVIAYDSLYQAFQTTWHVLPSLSNIRTLLPFHGTRLQTAFGASKLRLQCYSSFETSFVTRCWSVYWIALRYLILASSRIRICGVLAFVTCLVIKRFICLVDCSCSYFWWIIHRRIQQTKLNI